MLLAGSNSDNNTGACSCLNLVKYSNKLVDVVQVEGVVTPRHHDVMEGRIEDVADVLVAHFLKYLV